MMDENTRTVIEALGMEKLAKGNCYVGDRPMDNYMRSKAKKGKKSAADAIVGLDKASVAKLYDALKKLSKEGESDMEKNAAGGMKGTFVEPGKLVAKLLKKLFRGKEGIGGTLDDALAQVQAKGDLIKRVGRHSSGQPFSFHEIAYRPEQYQAKKLLERLGMGGTAAAGLGTAGLGYGLLGGGDDDEEKSGSYKQASITGRTGEMVAKLFNKILKGRTSIGKRLASSVDDLTAKGMKRVKVPVEGGTGSKAFRMARLPENYEQMEAAKKLMEQIGLGTLGAGGVGAAGIGASMLGGGDEEE